MRYDHIAAMNRAKDRKPATGGTTYKRSITWAPTPALGTWERLAGLTTARWECATGDALEGFLRASYPERYEGFP